MNQREALVNYIDQNPSLFVAIGAVLTNDMEHLKYWDKINIREKLCGDWTFSPLDDEEMDEDDPDYGAVVQVSRFIQVIYDGCFC